MISAVNENVDWPSVMLTVAVPSVGSGPFAAMTFPRYGVMFRLRLSVLNVVALLHVVVAPLSNSY